MTPAAHAVPSYARQMQVQCNACHTQFPELTAFGRQFKLSGYTLSTAPQIEATNKEQKQSLSLSPFPPLAVMFQAAYTKTNTMVPDAQNDDFQFPQQLSLLLAGKITPKMGAFLQATYSQADDKFGMDNAEIRFADTTTIGGKNVNYGVTLNNAPGVEDLWNSTPVWGFPWAGPDVSPAPAAGTLVDGQLSQDVAGAGAFMFWDSKLYAATTLYRTAHLGEDTATVGSENTIDSVAPYWRLAWQQAIGSSVLEVGAYGMWAKMLPEGISGLTDHYRDTAFDFQYETAMGGQPVTFHGTYIHEKRDLYATFDAGNAANVSNDLDTLRLDGSYYVQNWRFTLAHFSTTGDTDTELYAGGPVDGSANGSPDSRGWTLQASYSPWENVQFLGQYTDYTRFNGASNNYDGFGRDASDNNALFFQAWVNW